MNVRSSRPWAPVFAAFAIGPLVVLLDVLPASSEIIRQAYVPGQTPAPTGTQTTTLPAQSQSEGSAPLRVMVGKSLLINTTEKLKRISVTDPNIAYPQVVTPTQILVHGKAPGEVSLLIWDELERSRSFDLRVDVDVSACAEEEHRVFPEEQITVSPSRAAIVLSGHVSTEDVPSARENWPALILRRS
jgi:pilus assembly protein CpaC